MQRLPPNQIVGFSTVNSQISSVNIHRFSRSEQLTSLYHPNFKKLSYQRHHSYSSSYIQLRQIFNIKKLDQIITEKWKKIQKCKLCEYSYGQKSMFQLCKCNHRYCEHCLIEYVSYKINSMQRVQCPDENCLERIDLEGEIYSKLPEDLKRKYRKAQIWRQNINNPDLKLCPTQQCQGQVDMRQFPATCSKCKKQYCSQCMMQKHLGNCDSIYEMTHKEWRRCPSCRMFIAKSQGCNHIRCRCDFQFCFVCQEAWDSSHYNCMEKTQMFYFDLDQVKLPVVLAVIMGVLFPLLVVFSFIGIVLCFVLMIPVGLVIGIGLTLIKYYTFYCLVILIIPIGAVVGVVIFPFYFTLGHAIPYLIHHFRRYKITFKQLLIKLSKHQ